MKKLLFASCCLLAMAGVAQDQPRRPSLVQRGRLGRSARQTAQAPTPAVTSSAAAPIASGASVDAESKSGEAPALNWDAAPVDVVLMAYGERVGKTILKDPQVPAATITLKSREGQKLTNEEYLEAIETVLEMNQIHLEPYGESFIRALPRKDARKEGIPLYLSQEAMEQDLQDGKINDGKTISLMVEFKNIAIEEAQKALEGFKSNSGILLVFERTNSILVTDTKQNVDQMLKIATSIDVASPVTEVVEYIQIKYANANEVKQVIDSIVQESMKEQEKNGKAPQNTAAPVNQPRTLLGGGLLNRNKPQQPQAPVNNLSLVTTVSDADRGMIRGKVVTIADERSNKILLITNAQNMKFFKDVIAALDVETTPDTVVKVYRLKYAEAEDVSDMINDLIGNSSSSKGNGKGNQNQNAKQGQSGSVTRGTQTAAAKKPANQRSGDAKAGELNKDNTTVLADKRINGIVVMTDKELVPTIEQIIESMDVKLSQVLIETVIIEVTLGDDLNTGIDWVRLGDKKKELISDLDPYGAKRYQVLRENGGYAGFALSQAEFDGGKYAERNYSLSDIESQLAQWTRKGLWNTEGSTTSMLGGGGGSGANLLNTMIGTVSNATEAASLFSPAGTGLNMFLKSDALNLGAVIQASKTDSRAKYIASPVIMTVDNKEATIEATEARKFFSGFDITSSYGSNMKAPKYDSKDVGITIKVTPKINPNGTVMLEIEEEYSQLGAGQEVLIDETSKQVVDTSLTRKMSADILLDNMQTVILGGLTETYTSEKESGIPLLKDIPYIGKWLFGSVSQSESRKELLVFMTPYVMNDSESAQVEAIRRKKALSDPRPWDDHGWSLSKLADPVSKREQMQRIKDEWKKQDEERQNKIAIEKMKVDRAKKLQELTVEERNLWLKMHKEELEEEKQEELEEKMLDKDSQEELRKLAAKIRKEKLAEAEDEVKKAEAEVAAQNERGKLDAAKAEVKEAEGK